jgi:acetyl-CoA carboxylase biotin carboxylase subunit
MFAAILVANRGAAAARIIRACRVLRIRSIAVYSEADAELPYLAEADEAHLIGPGPPRESYLDQDRLLRVAAERKADAIHPGYGFLSENAGFARRVAEAGGVFIGPRASLIEAMGEKTRARALMAERGLPIAAGSAVLGDDPAEAAKAAAAIGYPVLVKPAGGGGGIGMLAATDERSLHRAIERARSAAARAFGNPAIYLERLLLQPRHIEFQVLGDRHGQVRALFERDCSMQRRHQKVLEESPAPGLPRPELDAMATLVAGVLQDLGYDNIGTVEMLRAADGTFNFLEVNTRLQVEHAVTEMVTGVDLVDAMIRSAAGERLSAILPGSIQQSGHAVEARVYAEDPRTFFPSPGPLTRFRPPSAHAALRVETGYAEGCTLTPFYDPMLAKVIAHAPSRGKALTALAEALAGFEVAGVKTNIPFLLRALADPAFRAGDVHTGMAADMTA